MSAWPRMSHWRAINPGVTGSMTVTSGASDVQVRAFRGPDLLVSQADSAGSIPVTRSRQYLPSAGRLSVMIAASPLRPLGTAACPLRARLAGVPATAGPSQFPPDHLVERARGRHPALTASSTATVIISPSPQRQGEPVALGRGDSHSPERLGHDRAGAAFRWRPDKPVFGTARAGWPLLVQRYIKYV